MDFARYVFSDPWFSWLCRGVLMTLFITLVTGISALALGTLVCAARTSSRPWLRMAGRLWINVFRNLPPVPLVLFVVLALPGAWLRLTGSTFPPDNELVLLLIGLSLNTSGYLAEVLRSGFEAVPPNQFDSARVLGLSRFTCLVTVISPQALRICLPALGNRLIHNMKNSTVALVVPLSTDSMELVGQAGRIAGQTFAWAEPLVFAAAVHLLLALGLSAALNVMAARAQEKVAVAR